MSSNEEIKQALINGNPVIIGNWQDDANGLDILTGFKDRRVAIIDLGPSKAHPEVPDDPGATLNRNG